MAGAWWCIHEDELLGALRKCHQGEDPDVVYAEIYANSDHTYPEDDDG